MYSKLIAALLLSILPVISMAPTSAAERKEPSWGAACPEAIDTTPSLPVPKVRGFKFTGTGQEFKLLVEGGTQYVTELQSVIGCYVSEPFIYGTANNPDWQIGTINRDSAGFYFKNAAKITWRLTLSTDKKYFTTAPGSTYYNNGNRFNLVSGTTLSSSTSNSGSVTNKLTKKVTIVCTKGALSKKVSDIDPKCPSGWKTVPTPRATSKTTSTSTAAPKVFKPSAPSPGATKP